VGREFETYKIIRIKLSLRMRPCMQKRYFFCHEQKYELGQGIDI